MAKDKFIFPTIVENCSASVKRQYKKAVTSKSRKTAIRVNCLMCVGGESNASNEVENCTAKDCPFYQYRLNG